MCNTRYDYNKKILNILSEKIEQCPEMRFIQMLWALGIDDGQDNFYQESKETYEKVKTNIKKIEME